MAIKNPTSGADAYKNYKSNVTPRKFVIPETTPTVDSAYSAIDADNSSQDFLSWALDIISRPQFAVTETISSAMDLNDPRQKIDPLSAVGHLLSAPIRGFFSTAPDDKIYTSGLIEKGTDIEGFRKDPDYKDVTDNADPIAKGVLGFIGDMALDPLTYITAGTLSGAKNTTKEVLKGGAKLAGQGAAKATDFIKNIGSGAKGAEEASTAVKAIREVDEVAPAIDDSIPETSLLDEYNGTVGAAADAEKVLKKAAPALDAASAVSKQTADMLEAAAENAPRPLVGKTGTEAIKEMLKESPRPAGVASDRVAQKVIKEITSGRKNFASDIPTAPVVREVYEEQLLKMVRESNYKVLRGGDNDLGGLLELTDKLRKTATPVSKAVTDEMAAIRAAFPADMTDEAFENIRKQAALAKAPANAAQARIITKMKRYSELRRQIGDTPLRNAEASLRSELDAKYKDYYAKFTQEGPITITGTPLQAGGILSPLETFKQLALEDSTLLKSVFGAATFNSLKRVTNPDTFNRSMEAIKAIFYKSGVLEDALVKSDGFQLQGAAERQLRVLEHLGFDYAEYQKRLFAGRRKAATEAALSPNEPMKDSIARLTLEGMEETAIRMGLGDSPILAEKLLREIVPDTMEWFLKKNFDINTLNDLYKYVSKNGILRNADKRGQGVGLDPIRLNTYKMWDLFQGINSRVTKMLEGSKLKGADLAAEKMRLTQAAQKLVDDGFREMGIPMHIDFKGKRYQITFSEITEIFAKREHRADILTEASIKSSQELAEKIAEAKLRGEAAIKGAANEAGARSARKAMNAEIKALKETPVIRRVVKEGKYGATQGVAKTFMELLLFNADTAMAPTKFMDAVAAMLGGSSKAEVRGILASTTSREGVEGVVENKLAAGGNLGRYRFLPTKRMGQQLLPGASLSETETGALIVWDSKRVLDETTNILFDTKKELEATVIRNAENFKAQVDADSLIITEQNMKKLQDFAESPETLVEFLKFASKPGKETADTAKAIGASQAAHAAATMKVEAAVTNAGITTAEDTVARAAAQVHAIGKIEKMPTAKGQANDITDSIAHKERVDANLKAADNAADDVAESDDLMRDMVARGEADEVVEAEIKAIDTADPTMKESLVVSANINNAILRGVIGGMSRFFKADYGMVKEGVVDLWKTQHMGAVLNSSLLARRVISMRRMAKQHSGLASDGKTAVLVQAFRDLQNGTLPTDPAIMAAFKSLKTHMEEFFDLSHGGKDALLGNEFFRNGTGLRYVNQTFKDYDILGTGKGPGSASDDFFDMDKALEQQARILKDTGRVEDILTVASNQWREWDIKDPLDFISKLNAASIHMATDVAVVSSFVREGLAKGFVSKIPFKGSVKLTATNKSRYTQLLPENVYVEEEVAKLFHRMEEVGRAGKSLPGKIGHAIHNYVDPVQNAWKVGITIYRPGHHTRNLVGDESVTWLAEGNKFWHTSAKNAFRVMAVRGQYTDVDVIRSLNDLGVTELPKRGDVVTDGKFGKMTNDQLYTAIHSRGLLPAANVVEDLYRAEGTAGKWSEFWNKASLQDTKFGELAGGVSEYRDHYSRIKHFMQLVEKAQKGAKGVPKFKSESEMFDWAAKRVQKFHPDASLLTTAEAKYARRLIPFYSWTRGAVPAVLSAAVQNPGRFQAFNKASYNLAVAMGVDPTSLSDPFPDERMFPSFLTDKMQGPQFEIDGKFYSVNPGIVTWDLASTFAVGLPNQDPNYNFGTMMSPLTNQMSPLIKMPLELLTGTKLGSQSRITDYSDYIDSSLPGLNYVASTSGYSPTGSLFSILQGLGFDRGYQFETGARDTGSQVQSAVNWLTGAGIQDYSKDSYQTIAELEKRDRLAKERGQRSAY